MAKEKSNKEIPPSVPQKKKYISKLVIFFGFLLIGVGVVDYLKLYVPPRLAMDIVLLLAGLWIIKLGFEIGFERRRKEMFKKYI